jgi:fumarate reductase flavoprotein subunit
MKRNKGIRLWALVLSLSMMLGMVGCKSQTVETSAAESQTEITTQEQTTQQAIVDGSYTAAGVGKNGDVQVTVVFEYGAIASVTVGDNQETEAIASAAIEAVPERIVKNQSVAVDIVSGATVTCQAILEAVKACIIQAGGNPDDFMTEVQEEATVYDDVTTDVLVIGGGGAGMVSAIFAAEQGAQVILVEKMGSLGGNTARAKGIFGCSVSSYQIDKGITATKEDHLANYMKTYPNADEKMMSILADKTGEAADWLIENGAEFSGTSGDFTIVPKDSKLGSMMTAICKKLMNQYNVDIRLENAGTHLLTDEDGNVTGAIVNTASGEYQIHAKSVIIATGGFSANNEMVTKYNPIYEGLGFISTAGNTGDGQVMGEEIGAQLAYMDVMKCNPFLYYDEVTHEYTMVGTYANPGIVVTTAGERVGNEHLNYYFSPSIMALEDKTVYLVYNEAVSGDLTIPEECKVSYDTVEELCAATGIDVNGLQATLEKFAESAKAGKDEFGRTVFQTDLQEGPYYAIKLTPAMQGTFGGLLIDENAQVYNTDNAVISGLYAAGECAGDGLYGANPVPTDCVFGKIAGTK